MHRTHLTRLSLIAIALLAAPRVDAVSSITSRTLIDPEGENNADFFGTSIAWIGDVNGDDFDDLLVGAFRYPEIGSVGRAYLYFGGPAMDGVASYVINPRSGGAGWLGIRVGTAGDFNCN